jgi:hypothetical protein
MLTESREAMNLRKTLRLHPYRRHSWTPTHFCLIRLRHSRSWYFFVIAGLDPAIHRF